MVMFQCMMVHSGFLTSYSEVCSYLILLKITQQYIDIKVNKNKNPEPRIKPKFGIFLFTIKYEVNNINARTIVVRAF